MRRIKLRGAGGTAALFVAAWVGIAAAGAQADDDSSETAASGDSLKSGIVHLLGSQLTEDDDHDWSFDDLVHESASLWGGDDEGHQRRSSRSPLSSAITGQS